jgi:hypothetical protein
VSGATILGRLHAAGVRVRLDPEYPDRLRLSPPSRLTPDLLELARQHKADLVAALRERARPTPEELAAWGEYVLERAAIMEADGELPRAEADRRAWAELLARYPAAAAHFLPGGAS